MSSNVYIAHMFDPYTNGGQIAKNVQKSVDNAVASQSMFGDVNYDSAYDKIISESETAQEEAKTESSKETGESGKTNGADGTEKKQPATAGDAIFGTNECTDGEDDGKIGFWEGCKSFFKGAAKSIVNTVVGIVTDPKKLLLTAGAVALAITFPPVGVAMAVAGGVAGVAKVGKGVYAATQATTDAQKKDALENCGAGTLQVGLSVVGAKAGIKAMKGTSGSAMSQVSKGDGIGASLKAFGKDVVTGGKGSQYTSLREAGSLWTRADGTGYAATRAIGNVADNIRSQKAAGNGTIKSVAKGTYESAKQAGDKYHEAKLTRQANKEVSKASKEVEKYDTEIKNIEQKLKDSKLSESAKEQLNDQLRIAKNNKIGAQETLKDVVKGKTDELQADYDKAKKWNDNAKKVEENAKSSGKELNETAQQRIQEVQKDYTSAETKLNAEKALSEARAKSVEAYQQSQTQITQAQNALDKAQKALKDLPKDATKADVTAATKAVNTAKVALKEAKSSAPDTSILSQGSKAAGESARSAGYGGKSPFLSATMGPLVYEMEEV